MFSEKQALLHPIQKLCGNIVRTDHSIHNTFYLELAHPRSFSLSWAYLLHRLLHVALLLHHRLVDGHWAWRRSGVGRGWDALPRCGHHVAGLLRGRRSLEHHGGRIHGSVGITGLTWRLPRQAHVAELGAQVVLLQDHTHTHGSSTFCTSDQPFPPFPLNFCVSLLKTATKPFKFPESLNRPWETFCPLMACMQTFFPPDLNEFCKSKHSGLITNPEQFVVFSQLDIHRGCAVFLFMEYSLRHVFLDELFKAGLPPFLISNSGMLTVRRRSKNRG